MSFGAAAVFYEGCSFIPPLSISLIKSLQKHRIDFTVQIFNNPNVDVNSNMHRHLFVFVPWIFFVHKTTFQSKKLQLEPCIIRSPILI